MLTRSLGPDAPDVFIIGLGCMPMSLDSRPSEDSSIQVIHAALDAGITLLDTADVYCIDDDDIGHNERLVAKALSLWEGDRDSIVVATKGGLTRPQGRWETEGRPEHLKAACEKSLIALGVERIDLYQFHAPDMSVPFEDSVGAFAELREEGKIRWVGLSNVSVDEIQVAESLVPVVTVQNRLNPFFKEAIDHGVVDYCSKQKIGFLAYSPVGGGRLTKKLPGHPTLCSLARTHDVSPHAIVLAWVLSKGTSVIPIPGARTKEHALDSIGAGTVKLRDKDLQAIDDADFPIG